MEDSEIKYAVVVRMWRDGIVMGRQYADVETVARQAAIPNSDEGRAKALLAGEMVDGDHCPVVKPGSGMVTLKRDTDAIREYLESLEGDGDTPWDLR